MKKKKKASVGKRVQDAGRGRQKAVQQPPPSRATASSSAPPRRSGSPGVPPLDAFDHVRRLPPPDLPGQQRDELPQQPRQPVRQNKRQEEGKNTRNAQRNQSGKRVDARPESKSKPSDKPLKPLTPARIRRNRRIAGAIAVIILIAGGIAFSVGVLFKINDFKLEGEIVYTLEEVQIAFGHSVGDNLFGFNAGQTAQRIEQNLPYIEKLSIKRQLPSTVVFKAEPAIETYMLQTAGGYAVLSASRKVLKISDSPVEGLSLIVGAADITATPGFPLQMEDKEAQESLNALLASLQARGITEVETIDVHNAQSISFRWKNRFTILVGSPIDLEKKLDFAFKILETTGEKGFSEGDHGVLDVSKYPENPQVVFSPE